MSLSIITGTGLQYSPFRDIVNAWPVMMKAVAHTLTEDVADNLVSEFVRNQKYDPKVLAQTGVVLASLVNRVTKFEDLDTALENSGFHALPDSIKIALLAKLGQITFACWWHGAKESTQLYAPISGGQDIAEMAEKVNWASKPDLSSARKRRAKDIKKK